MKKIACVVFELDENEKVEDIIAKIENACGNVNVQKASLLEEKDVHWRIRLSTMLKNLGENISTLGYGILFDIMEYVEKEPKYKKHFSLKELYGYVTEKTGKSYCQIDRNIRAMIERIYNNNSVEYVHSLLGIQDESNAKMCSTKFIALIIQRLF